MKEYIDDVREGWLTVRASSENVQGLLTGALLLGCEWAFQRRRCHGVEEVELPFGAAAGCQRVELYVAARRESDRLDTERFRESVVLALEVDDSRLAAGQQRAEDVGLHEAGPTA